MKLHVVHRTHYAYEHPVSQSFNEVRLQPVTADGQTCESFLLKVLPSTRLSHYNDFHFNRVYFFEIPEPHDTLLIESFSQVTTAVNVLPEDAATVPFSRLPECLRMESCYDFLQPSPYVTSPPEVWRLALDATEGQSDVWRAAVAIRRFIHANFAYTPSATTVNTHTEEVFQERRGVCQDFAHVMIGMCRAIKIPARYVSGYLYNGPADKLVGAQASHAWCEVYVPDFGWRALDPTNDRQADEHHVKVAIGRDYADIVPIKGHYHGTPNKTMTVEVSVSRSDG